MEPESMASLTGVFPRYDELSLTPRFRGVEVSHLRKGNRFSGLASGKTVKTVESVVRSLVTPLKRGVNETGSTVGQHAPKFALKSAILL